MTVISAGSVSRRTNRSTVFNAALLFAVVGLAWWQTVINARRMSSMLDGIAKAGSVMPFDTSPIRFTGMWTAMMAAMMLPVIIPVAAARGDQKRPLSSAAIGAGYLAVWIPTAVIAFVALTALNEVSRPNAWLGRIGGVAVVLAGAYEFTGYKLRLLEQRCSCDQNTGAAGAFAIGLSQGVRCLGCSWALMSVLLVVGVMNLAWMAAISAISFGEKTWTCRAALRSGVGLALIAFGLVVVVNPQTLAVLGSTALWPLLTGVMQC
jgi:predicted metal-binding membrane protein